MKRGSIVFLQAVLVLIGAVMLTWLLVFPHFEGRNANAEFWSVYLNDPFLAYVYVSSLPFFIGLHQAFMLLRYIARDAAFSRMSVIALRNMSYCAAAFAGFVSLMIPTIFTFAQDDDSPGVVLLLLLVIFGSVVIATAASTFQRLLQRAVDLQSENDLTV